MSADSEVNHVSRILAVEEEILDRKNRIESAFDRITDPSVRRSSVQSLIQPLIIAFSNTGDDEAAGDAATSLFHVISQQGGQWIDSPPAEASDELNKFISEMVIKYSEELESARFRITQGERWWSFIESDYVLSDDDLSIRHSIEIDRSETIEFDSAPHSEWALLNHLVMTQYELIHDFGEGTLESIDRAALGESIAMLNWIKDQIEERGEEVPIPEIEEDDE